jgi:hypothetical protein
LYSIGLEALAAAPREMPADETMAIMPQTNIGRASRSIMLLLAIMSPIGIGVVSTLTPSYDIG